MRRFITGTLLLALAILVGPSAGDAFAACSAPAKATAYDNPSDMDFEGGVNSGQWIGQSFTVPASITLTKATIYIYNFGPTTDSITVEIRSDSGGLPGALLGTRTRNLTNTAYEFSEFDFSSDHISLAAGTTYYVVATSTAAGGTDGYSSGSDNSSPTYSNGTSFVRGGSGGTWVASTDDLLFQVFGQTCTADTPPGGQTQPPALAAVSGLAFSNTTFAAENSGPPATNARRKPPRGTKVSFSLNEAATVRFTVKRRAKGRKVRRGKRTRCVRPTRRNRGKKRCTRLVTLRGSFSRTGFAGKNSFHFTGRLRGRKLKPGRYRLVATPSVAGKNGNPTSKNFRIVR